MPPANRPRRRRAHDPETPVEAPRARSSSGPTAPAAATPAPAAGRRSSSRAGRGAGRALRPRAADDQQPHGVHRGARGPALAARRQPRLRRDRLAADARLDDEVDPRLEAQGLEDRGRRPGQEPGPRARARRRDRPPRGGALALGPRARDRAQHAHKALNDRADRLAVAAPHAAARRAPDGLLGQTCVALPPLRLGEDAPPASPLPTQPQFHPATAPSAAACRSASSANEQSALTSRICSTGVAARPQQPRRADHDRERLARETATLRRLRLNRKSIPRGTSSPVEAVIEKKTTGASWPWNLSTVPTARAAGSRSRRWRTCALNGVDDEDVLEREVALVAGMSV